ncbi:Hypothetical predicted protein [Octopus vulgaris]|uniref:Uncharacterized protein n=1 Tax=Octopus vulgaris TaxID=6645 RepID=A0AA36B313_OCTVU|nr:Hypothetical predicted protein [Octopus vulgaris]
MESLAIRCFSLTDFAIVKGQHGLHINVHETRCNAFVTINYLGDGGKDSMPNETVYRFTTIIIKDDILYVTTAAKVRFSGCFEGLPY